MKHLLILILVLFTLSCDENPEPPNPSLDILFGTYTQRQNGSISYRHFDNQDSLFFLNLDTVLFITIDERYLPGPELASYDPFDHIYTFVVETSQGDREVFVSEKNVNFFGQGGGSYQIGDQWYSDLSISFPINLSFSQDLIQDNSTIELDRNDDLEISVHYASQLSGIEILDVIKIQK